MALISVNDFFSTAFWFILAIIVFILLLPIIVIVLDILDSILFSILDCIIYLPKGWKRIKKAIIKEWQTMFIVELIKRWRERNKKRL